ncbi:MAG TPA: rhomboid family intramembrane serine protease [Terriglobia bacterium]|nr:rhomboid family intramembrane serine protease [Terriglobia bacterium]
MSSAVVPEDHLEFLHAVWSRRPLFTYIFLGANIVIFLLMALAGGSTNESTLMAFGVKSNPAIARGEWWRFITPIFIHIGMLHLFFNSYALWIVGPQVEKLYGAARFVILYVLTGVAGVYASYFYHPQSESAGASGAIFGLFGVLLVFGVRYRNSIPPFFKRAVGTGVLPVIVINLIIGFTIPAIDNSAHLGGLLAGAALAALVPFQKPGAETPGIFKTLQMVLLALIVVSFYAVAKNYDGPHLSVRNLRRSFTQILTTSSTTQDFIDAINSARNTFEASAQELESRQTNRIASLKADTAKAIDRLRKIPSLASNVDELMSALLRVMQDQYELLQDVERADTVTFAHGRRLRENVRAFDEIMAQFSKWVETDGRRFGIQMRPDH